MTPTAAVATTPPASGTSASADFAVVGGRRFSGLIEVSTDLAVLDRRDSGAWVVVLPFEGPAICARFATVSPATDGGAGLAPAPRGRGPQPAAWTSSLGRRDYAERVTIVREAIAAGDVYQVNLCRRLSAPLSGAGDDALLGIGAALAARHPSPHGAMVWLPCVDVAVASASPECFLRLRGRSVESRPIKGTTAPGGAFGTKDRAENVMIVDLVRNDLGRVCEPGSVEVPTLCRPEPHPGLVHLVSTVRGCLRAGVGWPDLLSATFPPGSVTGAPKAAALDVIAGLEPVARGVYCGAVGWVDATTGDGDLNVAIRTFWSQDGALHFGTGAAVTWDSTPDGEWEETQLKAHRLLAVACGRR